MDKTLKLYKYKPITVECDDCALVAENVSMRWIKEIIENNQLYLSKAGKLNDLFEFRVPMYPLHPTNDDKIFDRFVTSVELNENNQVIHSDKKRFFGRYKNSQDLFADW